MAMSIAKVRGRACLITAVLLSRIWARKEKDHRLLSEMEQQKEDTPAFMGFVMWTKVSDIPADAFLHIPPPKASPQHHRWEPRLMNFEFWYFMITELYSLSVTFGYHGSKFIKRFWQWLSTTASLSTTIEWKILIIIISFNCKYRCQLAFIIMSIINKHNFFLSN